MREPIPASCSPARAAAPPPVALFDDWPDAILRFDAQRRVVWANGALERAVALPRAALLGRRLGAVEHFADYAPLWEAELAAVIDALEPRSFKFLYAHPTGPRRFDVALMLERDGAGAAAHVTALLRDATAPRTAIHASRQADALLSTLMEAAPVGMALLDPQLRLVQCNPALERLLGMPAAALRGRTVGASFAGDPPAPAGPQRIRSGAAPAPEELDYRSPAGGGAWLRERRTPLADARGRFAGVFVTVEPVEGDRLAETTLAALRQALDSAGEMVLELRRDGTVLDANRTALDWLGYERGALVGASLATIDAAAAGPSLAARLAELDATGGCRWESRYRTRAGSTFPVDLVLQRTERGGREFILLLGRDLSGHKRIEEERAEQARRLEAIFDESPVGMLLLDPALRIARVNRAAAELLGTTGGELLGREVDAFVHPDDEGVTARLRERFAAGATAAGDLERRFAHRDGHPVWLRLTVRQLSAAAGAPTFLVVMENYTERRIFEEQLKVALRDQQTLLETMSVGVVQALDGKILLANREFAQMFGYGDAEVIGMPLWDLCRNDDPGPADQVSGLPAVRRQQTTSAEVVLYGRDGEARWCLVQARAIERAREETTGVGEAIYTFQDISESKRQRAALARSLLELNVVLDATEVAVLHLDESGRIQRANAPAQEIFAGADGELAGRPFGTLFAAGADSDFASRRERIDAQLAAGQPISFETQLVGRVAPLPGTAAGGANRARAFWAWVTLRPVDARLRGMIVSIVNVSERKHQEEQLQLLLAESRLIFDTALVGLLFVREGRPVRANAAMEELLGCEPGALVGQLQLFAHPTDQLLSASLARHYADIDEEGACEFELHMSRRRGPPLWVAVQGRAVDPDRTELGYIFAFVDIDERKRSERELRQTLNELQLIFDTALVSMLYVADDLVVKANVATERQFGYPARDLRELQAASLFAESSDWDAVVAAAAEPAPAGVREVAFERRMRRADGSTFWCAGNARPIDAAAPERGLILVLMDVDQRRRSEDELRRVRNYLDLVVESLPVLVAVRDADSGRFVSINRAGETITGLARDQVVGRTWHELYGRQFADLYAEMDRRAIAAGQQIERPRDVWLRADGRTLTVTQRVVPLLEGEVGPDGRPRATARYVMSIIDDLSEEVRTEAALKETETRFRQFAENIEQIVFIAGADLRELSFVNARYAQVVGGPPSELIDDPRRALAHLVPEDAARLARVLPRVIAGLRRMRRAELVVRIEHPGRGERLLNVRLNPARMADGGVRVFGIAEDITERTAAEQQRLDEALKQRDILVREVHHRIKNNLQGVAGLLQHMAHAKPEVEATLNEIAGQIQAIAQVHGLQIRAAGTLPVLGVVQGIFRTLGAMFGAEVRLDVPPPALWRWGLPEGEAVPLALVVNELGTNAIKHRSGREAALAVRIEPRLDGVAIQIEQPGRLAAGFDLDRIASSVSGLGLVKALLPRRGARLAIEQVGAAVRARLELTPPAIVEDLGEDGAPPA